MFLFLQWRQFETGVSFCLDLFPLSRFKAYKKTGHHPVFDNDRRIYFLGNLLTASFFCIQSNVAFEWLHFFHIHVLQFILFFNSPIQRLKHVANAFIR